jgi:5-carboxymethyl-2-hydroxymuconate isomerase
MPHLTVQHSANIAGERVQQLCSALHEAIAATGLYPLGGIRVRALPCPIYTIADRDPRNGFVDMVFRIGTGRSDDDKKKTGKLLMQAAEAVFSRELASPHFALSLEIIEIDPVLSWKTNSMHARLKGKP